MVSLAKRCAGLTTPAAPIRWLRGILLMAQPPLLCEEGNIYATTITKYCTGLPCFLPNSLDLSSSILENENRFHQIVGVRSRMLQAFIVVFREGFESFLIVG